MHAQFADKPGKFITGIICMAVLICLSNAGGLSGAGSIIPLMLICFDMDMNMAVPCSAFVAVISTSLRFFLNFDQRHPEDENRLALDYEVVKLVMPAVFLGSMIGVKLGNLIGSDWQVLIFGTTVCWSIYTSAKKAREVWLKEKAQEVGGALEQLLPDDMKQATEEMENSEGKKNEEIRPALQSIHHEESHHFTFKRVIYILVNFIALFVTSFYAKGNDKSGIPSWGRYSFLGGYAVFVILITVWAVNDSLWVHQTKEANGYKFCANDITFHETKDVVKLSIVCAFAAILCGMTGIAGGMVLGPLFLSYNMIPSIMSNTNQYITMVASLSVTIQFLMRGQLNKHYSLVFGITSFISAFVGLFFVNKYIKKTGKQSLIAIILTLVLVVALLLLPLNYYIKMRESAKSK